MGTGAIHTKVSHCKVSLHHIPDAVHLRWEKMDMQTEVNLVQGVLTTDVMVLKSNHL